MQHQMPKELPANKRRQPFSWLHLTILFTILPTFLSLYGGATSTNYVEKMIMATTNEEEAPGLIGVFTTDCHHKNAENTTDQNAENTKDPQPDSNDQTHDEMVYLKYQAKNEDELSIASALGLPAILVMEDPKGGRSMRCLQLFHEIWSATTPNNFPTLHKEQTRKSSAETSRDPFYEWLDYGSGKNISRAGSCSRRRLNQRCCYVRYNATERAQKVVDIHVHDNPATQKNQTVTLTFASTKKPVPPGLWQFVWGTDRRLYLERAGEFPDKRGGKKWILNTLERRVEQGNITRQAARNWRIRSLEEKSGDHKDAGYKKIGHATIFRGLPVLHAGEMLIEHKTGHVVAINPRSGHYKPGLRHIRNFFRWIHQEYGIQRYSSGIAWQDRSSLAKETTEEVWEGVFALN